MRNVTIYEEWPGGYLTSPDCASGRQDFDPGLGFIVEESTKLDELAYVFFVALHCREWTAA